MIVLSDEPANGLPAIGESDDQGGEMVSTPTASSSDCPAPATDGGEDVGPTNDVNWQVMAQELQDRLTAKTQELHVRTQELEKVRADRNDEVRVLKEAQTQAERAAAHIAELLAGAPDKPGAPGTWDHRVADSVHAWDHGAPISAPDGMATSSNGAPTADSIMSFHAPSPSPPPHESNGKSESRPTSASRTAGRPTSASKRPTSASKSKGLTPSKSPSPPRCTSDRCAPSLLAAPAALSSSETRRESRKSEERRRSSLSIDQRLSGLRDLGRRLSNKAAKTLPFPGARPSVSGPSSPSPPPALSSCPLNLSPEELSSSSPWAVNRTGITSTGSRPGTPADGKPSSRPGTPAAVSAEPARVSVREGMNRREGLSVAVVAPRRPGMRTSCMNMAARPVAGWGRGSVTGKRTSTLLRRGSAERRAQADKQQVAASPYSMAYSAVLGEEDGLRTQLDEIKKAQLEE
jgi:hypothetical protein